MSEISKLPGKWREEAGSFPACRCAACIKRREVFHQCAEELERAWHSAAHTHNYDNECLLCQDEFRARDMIAEGGPE